MKVKELLPLLARNQETQLHFKNFGHYSSYPEGLLKTGEVSNDSIINYDVIKVETEFNQDIGITILKIYTNKVNG